MDTSEPRPPLNREWAEQILAEAEAVGRDCSVLRERMATYEARRVSGQTITQITGWLKSSVREVGDDSFKEWNLIDAKIRGWADEDPRHRRPHYIRLSGRYISAYALGHTIHWKVARGRRWLTLLGLSVEPPTGDDEPTRQSDLVTASQQD